MILFFPHLIDLRILWDIIFQFQLKGDCFPCENVEPFRYELCVCDFNEPSIQLHFESFFLKIKFEVKKYNLELLGIINSFSYFINIT